MPFTVKNISFQFRGAPQFVLNQVSFDLPEPGFHALFGPSGVGKTTLARMIIGQFPASSGEISTDGLSTFLYSYNLERIPDWSGVGNHIEKITPQGRSALARELIDVFSLDECLHKRFSLLSLGQQNRANLVRYLLQDFDLLIMDESLGNVDEPTREKIIHHIKELFPSIYFLYISHNIVEVAKFCRSIIVLREPNRVPQAVALLGQDARLGFSPGNRHLEKTMLEIVNAAA